MVLLRGLVRASAALGVDPAVLCAQLGLGPTQLEEELTVPTLVLARAWQIAPELSGDPLFGLHAAEQAELGDYDVLDYLFVTSATLGQALGAVEKFHRVISDIWRVDVVLMPPDARFRHWVPPEYVEPLWHAWDYFFCGSLKRVRTALGERTVPKAVSLMHRRAEPVAEYERYFGCPVEFEQPTGEFVFDAALLDRPLLGSSPSLHRLVRRHAQDLLARVRSDHDLLERARSALPDLLSDPKLSLGTLAKRLGVSARAFQRELAAHGTTYRRLVDASREELAVRSLRSSRLSVQEVGRLVGFESHAAFTRAFRRWRGVSPTAFRRASGDG